MTLVGVSSFAFACGESARIGTQDDAGWTADAGPTADADSPGGSAGDSQPSFDAGSSADAGSSQDASSSGDADTDAGSAADAGASDGSDVEACRRAMETPWLDEISPAPRLAEADEACPHSIVHRRGGETIEWSCGRFRYRRPDGTASTFPVFAFIPPRHRGVIYVFHGTGGSAEAVISRPHFRRLVAAAQGDRFGPFAFVATESTDRTDRQWDPHTGEDIERVRSVHVALVRGGEISHDAPVFSLGVSNGSVFSQVVSTHLGFVANLAHVGGNAFNRETFSRVSDGELVPQFYVLHENDHVINGGCTSAKRTLECQYPFTDLHPYLATRMPKDTLHLEVLRETPFTTETLRLIPELTDDQRDRFIECLEEERLIGPSGQRFLTFDPILDRDTVAARIAECRSMASLPASARTDVQDLLELSYAEHGYTSEFACEELDFLAAMRDR